MTKVDGIRQLVENPMLQIGTEDEMLKERLMKLKGISVKKL